MRWPRRSIKSRQFLFWSGRVSKGPHNDWNTNSKNRLSCEHEKLCRFRQLVAIFNTIGIMKASKIILVVLVLLLGVVGGSWYERRPPSASRVQRVLRAFQQNPNQQKADALVQLLDQERVSFELGNKILHALFTPKVIIQEAYKSSESIHFGTQSSANMYFDRMTVKTSAYLWAGDQLLPVFVGIGSGSTLSTNHIYNTKIPTRFFHSTTGISTVDLKIKIELFRTGWATVRELPWTASFPENLWATKKAYRRLGQESTNAIYQAQLSVPLTFRFTSE
jgi:hypothetical protein